MSEDEKNPAREVIADYAQAHFRYFRTADGTVYAQRNGHPVARPMRSQGTTGSHRQELMVGLYRDGIGVFNGTALKEALDLIEALALSEDVHRPGRRLTQPDTTSLHQGGSHRDPPFSMPRRERRRMAGHIQDRWFKTESNAAGRTVRVKSERHGSGLRYRARYIGPDGTEKSKSFPDGQKRLAEKWLTKIEADMDSGRYIDPNASRTTFRRYAEKWLAAQTTEMTTRESADVQLRRHAIPYMGSRPLGSFKPEHIRDWLSELERAVPASSYRRVIYASVSAVFTAAVEDDHLHRNPCKATTVRAPAPNRRRVIPWTAERTFAVRAALPWQYRAAVDLGAGCGLRQGEIFGLPADEIRFDTGWLHIGYQVKVAGGKLVFAPPKRDKERDVPLPNQVAHSLKAHMDAYPPSEVTLPWLRPDGPPVTKPLLFLRTDGNGAVRRTDFNVRYGKPALVAAGVIPAPRPGERFQAAREHGMHALRHFYASVLLDAGENVKALSTYLGHTDPGFTLRVYTHLLPSSEGRARRAVDSLYEGGVSGADGPQTAQER